MQQVLSVNTFARAGVQELTPEGICRFKQEQDRSRSQYFDKTRAGTGVVDKLITSQVKFFKKQN